MIDGTGRGIVGSADRHFSGFLSLVVQKYFLFTFLPFQAFFNFFCSVSPKFFQLSFGPHGLSS